MKGCSCRRKYRPSLGAYGLWVGRYLCAIPALTRDLGLHGLIWSRHLRQARGTEDLCFMDLYGTNNSNDMTYSDKMHQLTHIEIIKTIHFIFFFQVDATISLISLRWRGPFNCGGRGIPPPFHSVGCQLLLGERLRFGFGFIIILQVSFVGEISLNTFLKNLYY